MKKSILTAAALAFFAASAHADFIETRDRGILDGRIVSEDGDSVTFKTSTGTTETFNRKEILHLEDTPDPSHTEAFKGTVDQKWEKFEKVMAEKIKQLQEWFSNVTRMPDRKSPSWGG